MRHSLASWYLGIPILQIKRGNWDHFRIIKLISPPTYFVTHHKNRLVETDEGSKHMFSLRNKKKYLWIILNTSSSYPHMMVLECMLALKSLYQLIKYSSSFHYLWLLWWESRWKIFNITPVTHQQIMFWFCFFSLCDSVSHFRRISFIYYTPATCSAQLLLLQIVSTYSVFWLPG